MVSLRAALSFLVATAGLGCNGDAAVEPGAAPAPSAVATAAEDAPDAAAAKRCADKFDARIDEIASIGVPVQREAAPDSGGSPMPFRADLSKALDDARA